MPRPPRQSVAGICYHVLNRGNAQMRIFHKDGDYEAFLALIGEACQRRPMSVLAYCLMPNHFHFVVEPREDGDLSPWMQWLMTAHVRRYHRHHESSGHVWQGRFKSFPIEADDHLLTVLRYVERNPLRSGLAERAESWPWSSLQWWARSSNKRPEWLCAGPVDRPRNWLKRVNQPETDDELSDLGQCLQRGRPYGSQEWCGRTAADLGLLSSLRPRGRPRKQNQERRKK